MFSTDAKEVRGIKAKIREQQIGQEKLRDLLSVIEPLSFSERLKGTTILMINGLEDTIVPAECAKKLAESSGAQIDWYAADHYGMVKYIIPVAGQITRHFDAGSW